MKKNRYCGYCGAKMDVILVGAETVEKSISTRLSLPVGSKYCEITGKRQYCTQYICPNFKEKKWYHIFSPHNKYTTTKIITKFTL